MKRILTIACASTFALSLLFISEPCFAKSGGVGKGGGTQDGIFYHSHSDRSYSGKDQFKGKGNAYGRNKSTTSGKAGKNKNK